MADVQRSMYGGRRAQRTSVSFSLLAHRRLTGEAGRCLFSTPPGGFTGAQPAYCCSTSA